MEPLRKTDEPKVNTETQQKIKNLMSHPFALKLIKKDDSISNLIEKTEQLSSSEQASEEAASFKRELCEILFYLEAKHEGNFLSVPVHHLVAAKAETSATSEDTEAVESSIKFWMGGENPIQKKKSPAEGPPPLQSLNIDHSGLPNDIWTSESVSTPEGSKKDSFPSPNNIFDEKMVSGDWSEVAEKAEITQAVNPLEEGFDNLVPATPSGDEDKEEAISPLKKQPFAVVYDFLLSQKEYLNGSPALPLYEKNLCLIQALEIEHLARQAFTKVCETVHAEREKWLTSVLVQTAGKWDFNSSLKSEFSLNLKEKLNLLWEGKLSAISVINSVRFLAGAESDLSKLTLFDIGIILFMMRDSLADYKSVIQSCWQSSANDNEIQEIGLRLIRLYRIKSVLTSSTTEFPESVNELFQVDYKFVWDFLEKQT